MNTTFGSFGTSFNRIKNAFINSHSSITPFAGLIGGSLAGIGTNLWNNQSFFSKCLRAPLEGGICTNLISNQTIFKQINNLKQHEIKTCAFAIPYFPLITDIALTVASETYSKGLKSGFDELKKRVSSLPVKRLATPVVACAMGLLASGYVGKMLSNSALLELPYKFDPSGHVIVKITSAAALYEAVNAVKENVEQTGGSKNRMVMTALQVASIVATDALMMYTTGSIHHSAAEMIAGGLIAVTAYPTAILTLQIAEKAFQKIHSLVLSR